MYDERMVAPMRAELTSVGIEETRTAAEVDAVLGTKQGTVLVVVNSVCGCVAGGARPGLRMALEHAPKKPARLSTARRRRGLWQDCPHPLKSLRFRRAIPLPR